VLVEGKRVTFTNNLKRSLTIDLEQPDYAT
jgi:hypothetical protein